MSRAKVKLPSSATKNKRSHEFPVGALAEQLLRDAMERSGGDLLFPARRKAVPFNSWSAAKKELDTKIQEILNSKGSPVQRKLESWTFHDLRRTYATTLHRLGVKLEVVEALLNHVSGANSGIVRVYNQHRYEAEMREAVDLHEQWFIKTIMGGNA